MAAPLSKTHTWEQIGEKVYASISGLIPNKKGFLQWFATKEKIGYSADPLFYAKAYATSLRNEQYKDSVTVIAGLEGSGKSTLGCLYGSLVDNSFGIDRITVKPAEIFDVLKRGKSGEAMQIDEGALSLFSRESMAFDNRNMVKTFMVIRKKAMHVIICIPDFKLIDSYIRTHRATLLLQVLQRGKYKAVFGDGLKYLSEQLKYYSSVSQVRLKKQYWWTGWFKNTMGYVTPEEYAVKKDVHIDKFLGEMSAYYASNDSNISPQMFKLRDACKFLSMRRQTLMDLVRRGEIKAARIGKLFFIPKSEIERLAKPVEFVKPVVLEAEKAPE